MLPPPRIAIAILAGGQSSRMGTDKAKLVLPSGITVLDHLISLSLRVTDEVYVVGRTEAACDTAGARYLVDDQPGGGPLGGLLTALGAAQQADWLLLLACDFPGMTAAALQWLGNAALAAPDGAAAVGVRVDADMQPLFSAWRRDSIRAIRGEWDAGERSVRRLQLRLAVHRLDMPPHLHSSLLNVNSPEEWAAFRDGPGAINQVRGLD